MIKTAFGLIVIFMLVYILVFGYNHTAYMHRQKKVSSIVELGIGSSNNSSSSGSSSSSSDGVVHDSPETKRDLSEFIKRHKRIIDGELPPRISYNGLLVNGYGNRVYSFISTIVIGVLTDSAVLLNTWPQVKPLVKEPLYRSFHLFNDSSEFDVYMHAPNDTFYWPTVEYHINKSIDRLINTTIPAFNKRIRYDQSAAGFMSICANPMYYAKLYANGLVSAKTIEDAREKINNTKLAYEERLNAALQVGFDVGSYILRTLWHPQDNLAKVVEKFYAKHFTEDTYVIGLQWRNEFMGGKYDIPAFVKCAEMIENHVSLKSARPPKFKWFISTEGMGIINDHLSAYKHKLIYVQYKVDLEYDVWTVEIDDQKIVIDNELLVRCNELIVTGGSTFGFLAAMKSGRLPYYLNGRMNMTACKRVQLADPPVHVDAASF